MGEDWIPFCKRDKLPLPLLLGICAATLAGSLLWTIVFALFYPLAARVEMTSIVSTILLLMGSVIGFFVQPIVGAVGDNLTFKWGRRRIFIVAAGVLQVVSLLIIMFCNKLAKSKSGQQGFLIFGMIMVFVAGNLIEGPARTLCSDVTPPNQQVLVSSICGVYRGFGGIFTNLIGALSLYKYTSLSQEQFILVVCLCVSFVAIVITCIVAHEEPITEKSSISNPFAALTTAFKGIDSVFIRISIVYLFIMIATYQIGIQLSPFLGEQIYGGKNTDNPNDPETITYQKGVSWGMLCNMVSCITQFLYGFVQSKICDKIGLKVVLITITLVVGVMYLLFFFIKNRYVFLVMHFPIGLGNVAFNTLPSAVVTLISRPERLGANLALFNCFCVIGQQISNFGIGTGIAKAWPGKPGNLIGISCVFCFLAAIAEFFIVVPETGQIGTDDVLEKSDSEDSDDPAAL